MNMVGMMPKALLRMIYYFGYKLAKVCWFIFRPQAFGVKCIVQCDQEILLIRNSYGEVGWTFPGGGIHAGEPVHAAVVREVQEEVGITIKDLVPLGGFLTTKEFKKDSVDCFTTIVDKREFTIDNEEVVEAKWFSVSEMPHLTDSGARAYKLFRHHVM